MRIGPSTTSSRRRSIPFVRPRWWRSIRRWCARSSRKPPPNRREWSKKRERRESEAARAGVAHLVERNLPKVEVAGSRPVARSIRFRCAQAHVAGDRHACRFVRAPRRPGAPFAFAALKLMSRATGTPVDLSGRQGARALHSLSLTQARVAGDRRLLISPGAEGARGLQIAS